MNTAKTNFWSLLLLTGSFFAAQLVIAQSAQQKWRDAAESNQPQFELQQNYQGTTPGSGNTLPKVNELKNKTGAFITWPGFVMTNDGGSRLFLQMTKDVQFTTRKLKTKIIISFKKSSIFLANNRNPLVTTHFNTPIQKSYLKKRRGKVELVIQLKVKTAPTIHQQTDTDGYTYLFVDFPAGNYPMGDALLARPSYSSDGEAGPSRPNNNADTDQMIDEESPFE